MQASNDITRRIKKVLIGALSPNLKEEDLQYSERLDELLGLDSMAVLEFVAALEKEFGIILELEGLDLEVLKDLNKLVNYVARRTGAGPAPKPAPSKSGPES